VVVFLLGFGQTMEFLDTDFRSGDGRDELDVALVGILQDFPQSRQAVDGLFHGRPGVGAGAIAMLHLAVLLEKSNVVDRGFDA